jgi:large exoprotein involved in heme utilization and adhesion
MGGNILLDNSLLTTVGGHFQIGGISDAGTVGLTIKGNQLAFDFSNNPSRANINLNNQAGLLTTGIGGGAIQLWGNQITLDNAAIGSQASGLVVRENTVIDANRFTMRNGSIVRVDTLQANAGDLIIRAGEIELIGVSENGINNRIANIANSTGNAGNITITTGHLTVRDGGVISAQAFGAGNTGNVTITTDRLTIRDGGVISALTFGQGRGGVLTVKASELVEVVGRSPNQTSSSILGTQTQGSGNAGDLNITAKRVEIRDGGVISADSRSTGNAGNIKIAASESIEISGTSTTSNFAAGGQLGSLTVASGKGGNVTIHTRDLALRGSVALGADTNGTGKGGNINISAQKIAVLNGALISASTVGSGQSGSITIHSTDVEVIGTDGKNQSLITTQAGGFRVFDPASIGDNQAGNITISTARLNVRDGGRIRTNTFGSGQAGALIINASDSIVLSGAGLVIEGLVSSGLSSDAQPNSTGASGDLTINTPRLFLRGGAQVGVGTFGTGDSGTLTVNASELIDLSGFNREGVPSGLFASTEGSGSAGSIKLTTQQLNVRNFARVNVSSEGTGSAGDLEVNAGSVLLDRTGQLTASTLSGGGGNIVLNVRNLLLLRNRSFISTSAGLAGDGGDGGNITINSPNGFIVGVKSENSDITANAFTGSGGRVRITAQGIYGLQFRPNPTDFSDITASSTFGVSGTVTLNTPALDPSRGLTELPENIIDTNRILATSCIVRQGSARGTFFITGNGGLPQRPGTPAAPWFPTGTVQAIPDEQAGTPPHPDPIVEMDEIYRLPNGQVILGRACDH